MVNIIINKRNVVMIRTLSAAITVAMLSGCAGIAHNQSMKQFNTSFNSGDLVAASQFSMEEAGYNPENKSVDNLLWGLEAGAVLSYAGEYEQSTILLDASEKMMKSEDQEGVVNDTAELGLSMLGNDAMMAYEQTQYDGVMANTIKAWNFMFKSDFNDARVEWNRAEERQRRAVEYFTKQIKEQKEQLDEKDQEAAEYADKSAQSDETKQLLAKNGVTLDKWQPYDGFVNPYTTYSYGLNLLLNGKSASDFQKASDAFKRVYGMTNSEWVQNDIELALAKSKGDSASLDDMVWVIFENGQSAVKEEFRVDLPVFLLSDDVSYVGMALPRLKERQLAHEYIEVDGVKTQVIADIDKVIGAEFEKLYPMILTREISRTVLKTVVQKQAMDSNQILGNLLAVAQVATTNADTRSFTSLPKQFQTAHFKKKDSTIKVKAGNHQLDVVLDPNAKQHIVHVKAISSGVAPIVRVINI